MSPYKARPLPDVDTCPLCRARFIADRNQPTVARYRATGEPVLICGRCRELVEIGGRRYPAEPPPPPMKAPIQ